VISSSENFWLISHDIIEIMLRTICLLLKLWNLPPLFSPDSWIKERVTKYLLPVCFHIPRNISVQEFNIDSDFVCEWNIRNVSKKEINLPPIALSYKAIPVTGRGGPWGYETSRIPHFLDSRHTYGGEVVSFTCWQPFTSRNIPSTHFC
jgi:hypothetical protein